MPTIGLYGDVSEKIASGLDNPEFGMESYAIYKGHMLTARECDCMFLSNVFNLDK